MPTPHETHNQLSKDMLRQLIMETDGSFAQGAVVMESLLLGFVLAHERLQDKPGSVILDAVYDGVQRRINART